MIKNRLRVVRKARGVSQEELAARIGVKKASISKYETGRVPINETRANELAAALDCAPEEIFGFERNGEARVGMTTHFPVLATITPENFPLDLPVKILRPVFPSGENQFLEGYQLSEDSVEFRRRPPGVANAADAYCAYVPSDALLKFDRGDLVVVRPDRPARNGDPVLLTVKPSPTDSPVTYVGRLVGIDRQWTTLGIDRPMSGGDKFLNTTVLSCHKILSTEELLGF